MTKDILKIIALVLSIPNAVWPLKEICLQGFHLKGKYHRRIFEHGDKATPLTISVGTRLSSRIAGYMTRILLEDAFGYDNVVLVPNSSLEPLIVESLNKVPCRNESNECIPAVIIYPEVWAPFDWHLSQNPSADQLLVDVGSLGNTGRYDWYVSSTFVREVWKVHNIPADHWRGLQVPSVVQRLVSAAKLITIREMCGDCVANVFYPKRCDPAVGGEPNLCALLVAQKQGSCGSYLKGQIISLDLRVAVAWIHTSPDVLAMTFESRDKPLLFASFDPESVTTSGRFTRIYFPGHECNTNHKSLSNPSSKCSCSSTFELRKFVWKDLTKHKDALGLVSRLRLQRKHLSEMLQQAALENVTSAPYNTVCNWLILNNSTWLPWIPTETTNKGNIYIGGMFPNLSGPQAVWSSPGDEIGALMAVERVNKESVLLKGYVLNLPIVPTQCRRELVLDAYISYLNGEPSRKVIGILGPACSKPTIPMAAVSRFHNMVIMGYGADDVSLSDRTRYPYYFRTSPSIDEFKIAYIALFEKFKWRRCATLREMRYPAATVVSRTEYLTNKGIHVLSLEIPSERELDAKGYIKSIIDSGNTVIILDAYPPATRAIICEAQKQGLRPSNGYIWFLLGWLDRDWWDTDKDSSRTYASTDQMPCSSAEMKKLVDQGYFSLSVSFFGDNSDVTVGGRTVRQLKDEYSRRTAEMGVNPSDYATLAYDAIWTYALALDKLLVNSSSALENIFTDETSFLFREFIHQTDFRGFSGRVHFRNGDRLSTIIIRQNFATKSTVIGRFVPIIASNNTLRGTLWLDEPAIVWASGVIPSDSLPERQNRVTCAVEFLRSALDVNCAVAGLVAAIIAIVVIALVLCFVYWILKGKYSSKYRRLKARLKQLGLLDSQFASAIFALDNWELLRDSIILNRKLGQGAFGAVFGGEGFGIENQSQSVSVAVKTLKTGATVEEKFEFLSEADIMKHFSHDNIVQLFGVCTTSEPIYIVMELMIHGDLKSFLLARRRLIDQHGTPEAEEVTPRNLTKMALDIAQGLQYLAQLKYVHRDLALRNCMVGLGNAIKIGDFGLARSLNIKDYYRFERKAALPIRWMSPEAITEGLFTTQSDVWSYGVTLWEMATFGGFPYQGVSNQHVLDYVKEGNTLKIPENSSDAMASLLRFCWRFDYLDRPTPYRIVQILTENHELVHACLEVPSSKITDDSVGKFNAPRTNAHGRNRSRSTSASSQMSERIRTNSMLIGSSISSKQNIAVSSMGMQSPCNKRKNPEVSDRKTSLFLRL